MERSAHPGTLSAAAHAVRAAGPEDDAALRRLLRELPMDGPIRLTFEREPCLDHAAAVEGSRHLTVLARDRVSGRALGMGSRAVRWSWVNGEPARLGYLAQLRRRPELTAGRQMMVAGYAACEAGRRADELPYDTTCILADNRAALRLLERGLPGLPTYRHCGDMVTLILRVARGRSSPAVRRGTGEALPAIAACLQENLRRYQFAPLWTVDDLRSTARTRGLEASDFFCVGGRERIEGTIALWDQRSFKQVVVRGYGPPLDRWRHPVNAALWLLRRPRLPAVGTGLALAYLSHLAVEGDRPEVALALVRAARREAARRGLHYLAIGFGVDNPMLGAVRRAFPCRELRSRIYLTYHGDAPPALAELDGRCPHLEAATL